MKNNLDGYQRHTEWKNPVPKDHILGTSLVVQWLRLCTSTAGGTGSIPGWGSSSCFEVQPKKKKNIKRSHTVCFHLYDILEQNRTEWLPGIRSRGRVAFWKDSTREILGVMELFCSLIVVVVTCVCIYANTYRTVHQKKTSQFHYMRILKVKV